MKLGLVISFEYFQIFSTPRFHVRNIHFYVITWLYLCALQLFYYILKRVEVLATNVSWMIDSNVLTHQYIYLNSLLHGVYLKYLQNIHLSFRKWYWRAHYRCSILVLNIGYTICIRGILQWFFALKAYSIILRWRKANKTNRTRVLWEITNQFWISEIHQMSSDHPNWFWLFKAHSLILRWRKRNKQNRLGSKFKVNIKSVVSIETSSHVYEGNADFFLLIFFWKPSWINNSPTHSSKY